nr:hypothetical protein [Pseudomonas sp. 18058]
MLQMLLVLRADIERSAQFDEVGYRQRPGDVRERFELLVLVWPGDEAGVGVERIRFGFVALEVMQRRIQQ